MADSLQVKPKSYITGDLVAGMIMSAVYNMEKVDVSNIKSRYISVLPSEAPIKIYAGAVPGVHIFHGSRRWILEDFQVLTQTCCLQLPVRHGGRVDSPVLDAVP
ncbi:MAG: hypothetical protein JRJ12_08605 [Deltaproteobacteria bacterium]|nr:hypothetical protein [Deltaproteobacteria bacterium]MBW2071567.1 hypothetical protein [Deltaproteobacteria bacterium]